MCERERERERVNMREGEGGIKRGNFNLRERLFEGDGKGGRERERIKSIWKNSRQRKKAN